MAKNEVNLSFIEYLTSQSHVKGAGGGLHRNSLEIDFIVVSDRGE